MKFLPRGRRCVNFVILFFAWQFFFYLCVCSSSCPMADTPRSSRVCWTPPTEFPPALLTMCNCTKQAGMIATAGLMCKFSERKKRKPCTGIHGRWRFSWDIVHPTVNFSNLHRLLGLFNWPGFYRWFSRVYHQYKLYMHSL